MNIHISFTTDGSAHCLWTGAISLHALGHLEIRPATQSDNPYSMEFSPEQRLGSIHTIAEGAIADEFDASESSMLTIIISMVTIVERQVR